MRTVLRVGIAACGVAPSGRTGNDSQGECAQCGQRAAGSSLDVASFTRSPHDDQSSLGLRSWSYFPMRRGGCGMWRPAHVAARDFKEYSCPSQREWSGHCRFVGVGLLSPRKSNCRAANTQRNEMPIDRLGDRAPTRSHVVKKRCRSEAAAFP